MPKPLDEIVLGPWPKGMNNRQPDYALPEGTLRNAVNVNFDARGYARRRTGYSRVYNGVGLHSGYSCPAGEFFVEAGFLKRLNSDNTATALLPGITGSVVAYEYFDGVVYFSDGVTTGKIVGGVPLPWGMNVPPAPHLSTVAGVYGPGKYMAAITAVDVDGRESGASGVSAISAPADSGIQFNNLPSATNLRLYLSPPDGTVLYMAAEVSAGAVSRSISAGRYDSGKPLDTQFIAKPPPGRILRIHRGRMYIADGNVLWYTEPYALDWVRTASNFFQFQSPVTIVESVESGLWVVADKTYFFRGSGPETFEQVVKLNYGAVFGTSSRIPNTDEIMWYSTKGMVVAGNEEIVNKQEDNVAAESGTVGAALMRDKDGAKQFVASIQNPTVSPLVAQSFFSAEVIRKATT